MTLFQRRNRTLPALLSVVLLFTGSCKETAHQPEDAPAAVLKAPVETAARAKVIPTWQPQKPEFMAIAERLRKSRNKYVGYLQIDDLNDQLEQLDISDENVEQLFELHKRLGWEYARVGQIDRALEEARMVTQATQKAVSLRGKTPLALSLYGVVHLRKAELDNCVARKNRDRCLFPLRGGGVYEVRKAAEEARRTFSYYLELKPLDLHARWLLNLIHMALGDYPDSVPAIYRIPEKAFESDYDIGRFVNIASELGVDTFNCCGGCAVDDFDNDGFLDIVTSTWDPDGPMTFYRNLGNGRFEDRSAASRLDDQYGGLNFNTADYDNDGRLDILVFRGSWLKEDGRIRNSLIHNNGDGTFTDVTRSAGLAEPAFPAHAGTWGDYDNDGDLDVYIGNESRVANDPIADYPSQLFMNNGNGTFTDVAPAAGVTNDRYAKGVAAGDYDNDGDLDLYVSNIGVNRLYRNNGGGTFTDVAQQAGVTEPKTYSFTCWFFDYDNDGWLDLFVAAYDAILADVAADYLDLPYEATAPCLYRNNGDGTFTKVTKRVGLDHAWMPMGANFGDLDNDGFLDFYLGTGNPQYQSLVPNIMMRNNGGMGFQDVTVSGGFGHLQKGHGIGFADLDNDGDQDIYHQLGGMIPGDKFNNALFQNPGHGNHFLYIRLVGKESNRSGFGARIKVTLETPDGIREVHRAVGMVSSFGGSTLRQEIGLGDATAIREVEIWWPTSKTRQRFKTVEMDTLIKATEGAAEFERIALKKLSFAP